MTTSPEFKSLKYEKIGKRWYARGVLMRSDKLSRRFAVYVKGKCGTCLSRTFKKHWCKLPVVYAPAPPDFQRILGLSGRLLKLELSGKRSKSATKRRVKDWESNSLEVRNGRLGPIYRFQNEIIGTHWNPGSSKRGSSVNSKTVMLTSKDPITLLQGRYLRIAQELPSSADPNFAKFNTNHPHVYLPDDESAFISHPQILKDVLCKALKPYDCVSIDKIRSTLVKMQTGDLKSIKMFNFAPTVPISDRFTILDIPKKKDNACVVDTLEFLYVASNERVPGTCKYVHKTTPYGCTTPLSVKYNQPVGLWVLDNIDKNFHKKRHRLTRKELAYFLSGGNLSGDFPDGKFSASFRDENIDPEILGFSGNDVLHFCKLFNIRLYGLDYRETSFVDHYPDTFNKHVPALCFMLFDSHLHVLKDGKKKGFLETVNAKVRRKYRTSSQVVEKSEKVKVPRWAHKDTDRVCCNPTMNYPLYFIIEHLGHIPSRKDYHMVGEDVVSYTYQGETRRCKSVFEDDVMKAITIYQKLYPEKPIFYGGQNIVFLARRLLHDFYDKVKHQHSTFGPEVEKHFFPPGGWIRKYKSTPPEKNGFKFFKRQCQSVDCNKMRYYLTVENKYSYPVWSAYDVWELYDGTPIDELVPGAYILCFADPKDPRLRCFDGFSQFPYHAVQYLHRKGVDFTVKYQLIASHSLEPQYFKELFEGIKNHFPEHFKKLCVAMLGLCAQRKNTKTTTTFELDYDTAFQHWFLQGANDFTNTVENNVTASTQSRINTSVKCVYKWKTDEGVERKIFAITKQEITYNLHHDLGIWLTILASERIHCQDLIDKCGGELVEVSTDKVVLYRPHTREQVSKIPGGWKKERFFPIVPKQILTYDRVDPVDCVIINKWRDVLKEPYAERKQWTKNQQKLVNEILDRDCGCLVEGPAGVGKSYFIKMLKEELDRQELTHKTWAYTNVAAQNVDGTTIHRGVNYSHETKKFKFPIENRFNNVDYIIVDEISMVGLEMLTILLHIKRTSKDVKFILVGDFKQLQPVERGVHRDYKNCLLLKELCDYTIVRMRQCKRSDREMFDLCLKIYDEGRIDKSSFGNFSFDKAERHICKHNWKRKQINRRCMARYQHEDGVVHIPYYRSDTVEKISCTRPQSVFLKIGTPLAARCKIDEVFVNNEWTEVIKFDKDNVFVGKDFKISKKLFHRKFVVNFAMTAYKCQGLTFDYKYAVHETKNFSREGLYTAITRGKNKENILICDGYTPPTKTGFIYKLVDKTTGICYIGSTAQSLEKRLRGHEQDFAEGYYNMNRAVFTILKGNNYCMQLLEEIKFVEKQELWDLEGVWQRTTPCVNKRCEGKSDLE